jgi:hypothetical protein
MTSGERRFARRLEALLEDDYLCWYDVPLGPRERHPDFVLLHPRRGLLVLEVKDWRLESLQSMTRSSATMLTPQGMKEVANPLEQARQYAHVITDLLTRDPLLTVAADQPHAGQLAFPYGYGVVLANITRRQFTSTDLGDVLNPELVICQDEMTESIEADAFQERLWRMFRCGNRSTLTLPQIDRIRWHLFPEVRVHQGSLFPADAPQPAAPVRDQLLYVMDLQQEQLARSLGDGHRVIHGVAGSGKTLILGYRCAQLAKVATKPILVLCYNVSLASKLQHLVSEHGIADRVAVRHFHGWCADQLRTYHVPRPSDESNYHEALVKAVIAGVDRGQIPRAQYAAVLLDEGHDFEADWLKLIVQMIDPATNSLLLLYDDAQSIYATQRSRKFSFASVGVQARGRTTILRLNYRNTAEVLSFAYRFAKDVVSPEDAEDDGIPLIGPETAGRHGESPELVQLRSLQEEIAYIAEQFRRLHTDGRAWRDMAVVYRARFVGETAVNVLRECDVPCDWLQESKQTRHFDPGSDRVKVMTMHSSKGLEFPIVAIPGIGYMPYEKYDERGEARLLYVAMTRAVDRLIVTAHRRSTFAERLLAAG